MTIEPSARQARLILDDKYAAGTVDALRARPRSGWIRAVRTALGMSEEVLAQRLGVSRGAVTGLENAERDCAITVAKLAETADALDCTLVYALVPRTSLELTVQRQAVGVVDGQLGHVNTTMAPDDQAVGARQQEHIRADRIAEVIERGDLWKTT